MTGGLQLSDGDGSWPCAFCGREAAGPCARCRRLVCGDCCTLTEGGVKVWAICLECDRTGGASLRKEWLGLLTWMGGGLVILATLVWVLLWLTRGG